MTETGHPALLTWDQIEAAWESVDSIFETEEMEPEKRALVLAQACRVVEWLSKNGFSGTDFFSEPVWYIPTAKWQELREVVGLVDVRS